MPSITAATPSLVIRKSNALIEASYKLTVSEQRLLIILASEISPDDEDFKDYEIRISDFAKMFELELHSNLYDTLQNAALSLMKQQLRFNDDSVIKVVQWLSYIEYVKGSGVVKLRFDKALTPHLLQLKQRFTQYRLDNIIRLSGQYSARLYELLRVESFKAKNGLFERFFQIDELREILGIDDNSYPVFNDFKLRVINPSVNEISGLSDLMINDVKYGKTGRKITNVTFVVTTRETKVKTEQNTKPEANRLIEVKTPDKKSEGCPMINTLVGFGISLPVANTIKNKHDTDKIHRNIAYTMVKKQAGEIKTNIAGYLNKAIEQDYAATVNQASLFDVVESVATIATKSGTDNISKNNDDKEISKKEKMKQVLHNFSFLAQDRQEKIQMEFLARCCKSDSAAQSIMRQTKMEGKSFYSHPIIEFRFLEFIIANKIC